MAAILFCCLAASKVELHHVLYLVYILYSLFPDFNALGFLFSYLQIEIYKVVNRIMYFASECSCFCPPFCWSKTYRVCRSTNMEVCVYHIYKKENDICVYQFIDMKVESIAGEHTLIAVVVKKYFVQCCTVWGKQKQNKIGHLCRSTPSTLSQVQRILKSAYSTHGTVILKSLYITTQMS